MQKSLVLLLIIYIGFSAKSFGQNLQLKIEGTTTNQTAIIDSIDYSKNHKDLLSIKKEVDTLNYRLSTLGYIESEIDPISKVNDSLFRVELNLGEKFESITIYYNTQLVSKDLIEMVSEDVTDEYFVLPFHLIEPSLEFINLKTSEKGLPFNEIKLSEIRKVQNNQLSASLIVSKIENKREVDKIIVKGYKKFPKSYLKHYLKVKRGNTLNLTEIKNKTRLLNDLQFANQIREPEILFSKDSTILYIYVEKNKSNSFDGFLGFGTNEKTNNLEFNGYLNLDLINNLNYGESFSLIYKSDENEQKTFNVRISLPYLFATPLGAELGLNIFKKDSSFTTVNQNARIFYQLDPKNKFSVGLKSIESNNLLEDQNTNASIQDYKSTFYNVRYEFLLRQLNSRLFRRNTQIDFEVGFGNRNINRIKTDQVQIQLDAFKIFNLNNKNSIFLRTQGFSLISNNYLENELTRFGGINSIRGFEENSISASFYTLLNTEYRYLLSNGVYVHSIIDIAYFENDIAKLKQKLYGFGIGFGLLTKAGLLKFIYANGKNENQTFKFSNSQIHISLTAIF